MKQFFQRNLVVPFLIAGLFFSAAAQQKTFEAPALSDPDSWSIIMLPDPQTYQKFDGIAANGWLRMTIK